MGSITRRPTPPGPITYLFDRLNQLHLEAGEPSLRRIADEIGRGVVSYSTVYNALAGPRIPAWGFLELIVAELGGDPEEFRRLWTAARQAEHTSGAPPSPPQAPPTPPPAQADDTDQPRPTSEGNIIWDSSIPPHNLFFAAREAELRSLRDRLTQPSDHNGPPVQVLFGQGGVGKTQLAVEFAHRHRREYDAVWFIKAETVHSIRESLIELGRRLQLHDLRDGHSDHLVEVTLRALRLGVPYERSLIILDNCPRPEGIAKYLPGTRAHVLVTSQSNGWHHLPNANVTGVLEFTQTETLDYLSGRIPGLSPDAQTAELAVALTGLPLAVELAAANLIETESHVASYLDRFRSRALATLDPDTDFLYPQAVAICLSLAQDALSAEAAALLKLIALISPEPIAEELLVQPGLAARQPPELRDVLSDTRRYRRTVRELAQFSLVRLDSVRNEIQLHRVVQAVLARLLARDDPATEARYRQAVHLLLAGSDPGAPQRDEHEPAYEKSYPHLIHAGAVTSDQEAVRDLITNHVRRLYLRGRLGEAYYLARPTLDRWRQRLGEDHLHTLELATELSVVLRLLGNGTEALELTQDTLRRLADHHGADNQAYLICSRNHSTHLRFLGRYEEAQRSDLEQLPRYIQTFGEIDFQTLNLLNNIAVGLRCMGRYEEALDYDRRTYEGRARAFGPTHPHTLDSQFALARDLRRLGRYEDSLDELVTITRTLENKGEPWSLAQLLYAIDLSVALRRVGNYQEALNQAEIVLQRHQALVGAEHQQSLSAATNLITDRRITGELDGARELGEETVRGWTNVAGAAHPNTLAAMADLAVVLRHSGDIDQARDTNTRALTGLAAALGDEHPHCLVVMCNLASDHAAANEPGEARRLGEQTLTLSRRIRGETHPFTLAIAANLALDLQHLGDENGRQLHEETIRQYETRLPARHPEIRAAARRARIDLDVETDHT